MYQPVHEPIHVIGVYTPGKFTPRKFKWRGREFWIHQITLASNIKDGGVRKRFYSVTVGKDVYRLEFNRETEHWLLEEIWVE